MLSKRAVFLLTALFGLSNAFCAQALNIVSTSPTPRALNRSVNSSISVTFDSPLETASVTDNDGNNVITQIVVKIKKVKGGP